MMTEITQKSYKDLFPLWSLKKKGYIEINNTKKTRRRKIESIGKNLDIEGDKKVKLYFFMNYKKGSNFVFRLV